MRDLPIDVEPDVFDAASKVFGTAVAVQLTKAVTGLVHGLGTTGEMAGNDPGGIKWASAYDQAASVTVAGMTDLANASYKLAAMLELTGFNHGMAEGASNPLSTTPTPADTTKYPAPSTLNGDYRPPSAKGGSGRPPDGWSLIQHLVGYVWPNGHQDKLRTAAQAWTAAANTLNGAAGEIPSAVHAVQSQKSPEVDDAVTVCQAMQQHVDDIAGTCRNLASASGAFADQIDKAHKEVEDELKSLLAWTVGIEAGGALLGAFTFGIGEGAAQIAEGTRVAATAGRVGTIIARLVEAATTAGESVGNLITKVVDVAQRLKAVLGTRLARTTAEEVKNLPEDAKTAETLAEDNILVSAESAETSFSTENVATVREHLSKLDHFAANDVMLQRIDQALQDGKPLTDGETNFMRHELAESDLMDQGMSYEDAHELALKTHPPGRNYDPDVINQFEEFGPWWRKMNGLGPR